MNKQQILAHILKNTDIYALISQAIQLSPKGRNTFVGLCPFHEDTNPSLSVSISKQIFKCFSCQKGGNIVSFVMLWKNLNFFQAIEYLNKEYNLNLKLANNLAPEKVYSQIELQALRAFENSVSLYLLELLTIISKAKKSPKNRLELEIYNFINSRGLSREIIEKFKIGFAPSSFLKPRLVDSKLFDEETLKDYSLLNQQGFDFFQNRIVFPIENLEGKVVGFSGRCLPETKCEPKYLNSPSSKLFSKSEIFYNYKNAIADNRKEIFITEGFFDVIAFYKVNIKNVIALMGTSLTKKHCELLNNFTVVIALDGDRAGLEATLKSALILSQNQIKTYIISGFDGKDPDEYLNNFGAESFLEKLSDRKNCFDFAYSFYKNQIKKNSSDEITEFVNKFTPFLQSLHAQNSPLLGVFLKKIKEDLGIEKSAFRWIKPIQYPSKSDHELEKYGDFFENKQQQLNKRNNYENRPYPFEYIELKLFLIVLKDFLEGDQQKFSYFKSLNFKFLNPLNNKFVEKLYSSDRKNPEICKQTLQEIDKVSDSLNEYLKIPEYDFKNFNVHEKTLDDVDDYVKDINTKRNWNNNNNLYRFSKNNGKDFLIDSYNDEI
ncbi:DNA primase [Mesomycoplasma ovipneumoniae]|uniref:DNA primase n=1 Tax=Mesomycoplasma ovipneumoniae TaxID=29562 RepID=A0AAJ2P5W2_9BACT|nr:DNA primase [Mesomycoplasma ovipneumoniae]MDW2829488.1 DNA primase [Mesomycoplasma ovipneumoniae]MDW2870862.1 DNA primase [Mesomycoplasma ovipneumoniae]MDW2897984.1 DNA primase [Mesomycoplasma ovipneumoniae]